MPRPSRSAILAHIILQEKLNIFGMLGCLLCITGSITIVLHAPPERHLGSVVEVWQLAMHPGAQGLWLEGAGSLYAEWRGCLPRQARDRLPRTGPVVAAWGAAAHCLLTRGWLGCTLGWRRGGAWGPSALP